MATIPIAEPQYLTTALRNAGVLGEASVRDVAVESDRQTLVSRILRLRLEYDGEPREAPGSIILKTAHPERVATGWEGGRKEVAFYRDVAAVMSPGMVPRCFEAHADDAARSWHLLLEDLTNSHMIASTWPLPPSLTQCERIIEARARFHAVWWDEPRLGASIGVRRDAGMVKQTMRNFGNLYERFAERLGDDLSAEHRALYERFQGATDPLIARYEARRDLTITHNDAHVWNCFMPRDGSRDVRLFDWDSWRIGVGASDLAYMIAVHWYPERRRRMERALLDRYHAALVECGVRGYDRQALDDDYRLAVLWQIATPVWQAAYDIPSVVWWNNMQRVLMAVDDLGCREWLA
jgi:thiamine kinase-like enzyme